MAGDVTTSVTAVISVVDKATPAIDQITASLKGVDQVAKSINTTVPRSVAEMVKNAPGNIFNLPVRQAPDVSDVLPDIVPAARAQVDQAANIFDQLGVRIRAIGDKIQAAWGRAFSSIGSAAQRVSGVLGRVFSGWGAFIGGFGIGTALDSMVSGMNELVKTVDELAPQATSLGLTIQEFQRLSLWAKEGGVPVNKMATSLQNLTRTMGGVNEGLKGFGKAEDAFRALGLLDEATGRLKAQNAPELLRQLGPALAAIADPGERAARAAAILGTSWRDMLPLLLQGPDAMDKAAEASKRLGEISPDMQKAAEDYKKATADFAQSLSSLRMGIGATLIPVLTPAIKELTDFIAANREGLTAVFKGAADAVIGFFETVGPVVKSTAADLAGIKEVFVWIADKLPSVKSAGPLFTPVEPAEFAPPPDFASAWADPITKIRDAIEEALKAVEGFFATISTKGDELFGGALATKIGDAFRHVSEALQTPLADVWTGAADAISRAWLVIDPILAKFWQMLQEIAKWTGLGGVATAFEGIAGSITKAQEAWQKWRGATETPTAVSPGGGPIAWGDLAGQTPGGLIGPVAGGEPANGRVDVNVTLANAPPGTRATTQTTGTGVRTQADVGYSMPWTQPPYSGPWAPGAG
jgi:hypothetical protein